MVNLPFTERKSLGVSACPVGFFKSFRIAPSIVCLRLFLLTTLSRSSSTPSSTTSSAPSSTTSSTELSLSPHPPRKANTPRTGTSHFMPGILELMHFTGQGVLARREENESQAKNAASTLALPARRRWE